jgi:hypothetical protein
MLADMGYGPDYDYIPYEIFEEIFYTIGLDHFDDHVYNLLMDFNPMEMDEESE